jgi:hypothetical protein
MPESHLCRILLVLRLATKDSFFANDLLGRPISEPNNCLGARLMFQRLVLEGTHKCSGDWKTVETRVRDESANTSIISCRRSNSFRRHMATTEGRVHRGSSERLLNRTGWRERGGERVVWGDAFLEYRSFYVCTCIVKHAPELL